MATLRVRVTPRAGRDALAGWREDVLLVRLAAPPVEDRANAALVRFLAGLLDVPAHHIDILSGESAREKRLSVAGRDDATLHGQLERLLSRHSQR